MSYLNFLSEIHRRLRPAIYLEIGVQYGHSLALARNPTKVIGVDPEPKVTGDVFNLESVTLHHMTSDAFFAGNHCPQGIEFAFIDGLHHFDQVLTDLVNLEPFLAPNAVVALHDTLPRDARTSARILTHDHWTGDVWKVVPILQDCRPEVEIYTIDTPPSGLTLSRNLGSAKRTPKSVIAEWMGDDFSSYQRPETHVKLPNWIA